MKRAEWIKRMAGYVKADEKTSPQTFGAIVIGNRVAVMNLAAGKIGVATCSPTDDFDLDTGLAIAYARMVGRDIPQSVINGKDEPTTAAMSNLKCGQRFHYLSDNYTYCGVDTTVKDDRRYMVYCESNQKMYHFVDDVVRLID